MQLNLFRQSDFQPILIKIKNVQNAKSCNADIKKQITTFSIFLFNCIYYKKIK